MTKTKDPRTCPACGEVHAHSILSDEEIREVSPDREEIEPGWYRVFTHGDGIFVVGERYEEE